MNIDKFFESLEDKLETDRESLGRQFPTNNQPSDRPYRFYNLCSKKYRGTVIYRPLLDKNKLPMMYFKNVMEYYTISMDEEPLTIKIPDESNFYKPLKKDESLLLSQVRELVEKVSEYETDRYLSTRRETYLFLGFLVEINEEIVNDLALFRHHSTAFFDAYKTARRNASKMFKNYSEKFFSNVAKTHDHIVEITTTGGSGGFNVNVNFLRTENDNLMAEITEGVINRANEIDLSEVYINIKKFDKEYYENLYDELKKLLEYYEEESSEGLRKLDEEDSHSEVEEEGTTDETTEEEEEATGDDLPEWMRS